MWANTTDIDAAMKVTWGTCGSDGSWCGFLTLNIDNVSFNDKEGIYIIWQAKGPILKIGKGNIREGISREREDSRLRGYDKLFVTWASIPPESRSGVELFLATRLHPLLGDKPPKVIPPVEINLPWNLK